MKLINLPLLLASTILFVGCDGQAEDSAGVDDDTPVNVPIQPSAPTNGSGVNSGLSGRIVTTFNFQPYEFDLSTGTGRELPLVTNKEHLDSLNDGQTHDEFNYFSASPNPNNQRYLETSYSCFRVPPGSCLSVYNSNFQTIRRIAATDRVLQSPAKLSHSGELIVMSDMEFFSNEMSYVLIVDVDSRNVADSVEIDHEIAGRGKPLRSHPIVEWGLNDEVIFSVPADDRPTVYITNPGTTDVDRTIRLPSSYTGVIKSIDLHPNGRQVLLGYEGNKDTAVDQNGLAIVLDLADLSLRIPAVNQADAQRTSIGENFISQYVNPIWSPDGNHILFLNQFLIGGVAPINSGIPIRSTLVAIPADSNRVIVNQSFNDSPPPAIIIQLGDPINSGQLSPAWRGDTFNNGHFSWVQ